MSINRLLGLTALLFTLMLTLSPGARAANCWNGSPAGLSFGTVTPGQSSATSTKLPFTCNNYDGHTEFVRACLKLMANDPIPMSQNEPSTTPLYFSLYSIYDLHHPLSQNSDVYAQIDLELASGQANVEHDIPLIGKINAGQNNVSAGNYYDYATSVQISYSSASSMQSLPSCSGLSGTTVTDQISATATVKNGCEILNVDDMDFGHRSPVQSSQLEANATANITIQCPTGTSYAVSIGEGYIRMATRASSVITEIASATISTRTPPTPRNGRLRRRKNSTPTVDSHSKWWSMAKCRRNSGLRRDLYRHGGNYAKLLTGDYNGFMPALPLL